MTVLPSPVTFHVGDCRGCSGDCGGIHDAEAWVQSTINRKRRILSLDEREELVQIGLAVLSQMAKDYEPGRGGANPATSTFSGFASAYLAGKMDDRWHRLHENHQLVTDPESGKRHYEYHARPASLSAMTAENPEGTDHIVALQIDDVYDCDLADTLGAALDRRWVYDREITIKVGVLLSLEHKPGEIRDLLRVSDEDVQMAWVRIKNVAHELREAA